MAIVGTAYVRVKLMSDKLSSDLTKSVSESVDKTAIDNIGRSIGERIHQQIEEKVAEPVEATVTGKADTEKAKEELDGLAKPRDADVEAKAKTEKADEELKWLTQPRTVLIKVLTSTGAFARISSIVGGITTGILGLVGVAGAGIANISSLAYSLVSLGPALFALPGLFAGAASGMLMLSVVMSSVGKKGDIKDVANQFTALKKSLGDSFWQQALGPFKQMVQVVFPMLRYELGGVFKGFGDLAASLFSTLRSAPGMQLMVGIFRDMRAGWETAAKGAGTWTLAILQITKIGTAYLPEVLGWVNKIGAGFAAWLNKSLKDGAIFKDINAAIGQLKLLGTLLMQTVGVLGAFGRAAAESGGSTLQTFVDGMHRLNDALSGAKGQKALIQFFQASHTTMAALTPGLTAFGVALRDSVIPALQYILPAAGKALGNAFAILAGVLGNPTFIAGLGNLVLNVSGALGQLAQAAPAVGVALGNIGKVMGSMLGTVGDVLSTALIQLAPAFSAVGDSLAVLIPAIGAQLVPILKLVGPIIVTILDKINMFILSNPKLAGQLVIMAGAFALVLPYFTKIGDVLGKLLGGPLKSFGAKLLGLGGEAEGLGGSVGGLWGVLSKVGVVTSVIALLVGMWKNSKLFRSEVTELAVVLWDAIKAIISGLMPAFKALGPAFDSISHLLGNIVGALLFLLVPALKYVVVPVIGFLARLLGGVLASSLNIVTGLFQFFISLLSGDFSGAWAKLKNTFMTGAQPLADVIQKPLQIAARAVGDWFKGIGHNFAQGWRDIVSGVTGWLSGVGSAITDGLSTAGKAVTNWFVSVGKWFSDGWQSVVDGVTGFFSDLGGAITSGAGSVSDWFSPITSFLSDFWGGIGKVLGAGWTAMWEGVKAFVAAGILSLDSIFTGNWAQLGATWQGFVNDIRGIFGQFWGTVTSGLSQSWGAIVGFAKQMWALVGQVGGYVAGLPGRVWGILSRFGVQLFGWALGVWAQVTGAFARGINWTVAYVNSLPGRVWGYLWPMALRLAGWAIGMWATITKAFSDGINWAVNFIAHFPDRVWGYLKQLGHLEDDLRGMAHNVVQGFINGITDKLRELGTAVTGMAHSIISWARQTLGINSPSRVFRKFGRGTAQGLILGIKDMMGSVAQAGAGLARAAFSQLPKHLGMPAINLPVPHLATGGIVPATPGGSLNVLGEAGKNERVEPLDANGLSKGDYALLAAIRELVGAGGGISIGNIIIPLEDLAQLKTLEDFVNMLRIRTRKAG